MFVILGATGNIGSALVEELRPTGQPIIALTHSAEKAAALTADAVEAAVVDVTDTDALRAVFRRGKRAFLLNPPGDPSGDSNAAELATGRSIAAALEGSGLEKLVVASTYGAQAGDAIGDLSTLHAFERAVEASGIPTAINRGAYYLTNLAMFLDAAKAGVLPAPFPANLRLPMVDPADLARAAAERLQSSIEDTGIVHVEGPERYTFNDVASAFAEVLGHPVYVETTPREQLADSFRQVGFSSEAARSFARMTEATIDGAHDLLDDPRRGGVTLHSFIRTLVSASK